MYSVHMGQCHVLQSSLAMTVEDGFFPPQGNTGLFEREREELMIDKEKKVHRESLWKRYAG